MNIGFLTCATVGVIFLLLAIIFTLLKGKAAMLMSGFNTMPKEKRELYDQERLALDQRNTFRNWTCVMTTGMVFSYYFSYHFAIAAFIIWIILFFKDLHLDAEKAFEKYKIK